jgi:hypothetical protein
MKEHVMTQMTTATDDAASLAAEFMQWYLANGTAGPVLPKATFGERPERSFSVKGSRPRKFLQHENQTFGINLGWTDNASPATEAKVRRWFLDRPGTDTSPIRYGEPVALGNGGKPSFIRYGERTVGINLEWSDTPVFEWKLLGGTVGQPVNAKDPVAIYNTKAGSAGSPGNFLIYFDRTAGGDIGWPDSTTWDEKLLKLGTDLAWSAAKKLVLAKLGVK